MFTFDGNWCKLTFIGSIILFLILWSSVHIFGSSESTEFLFRFGKVIGSKSSKIRQYVMYPKSYSKYFYLVSAFVYIPIAWYQIIQTYVLDNKVPSYFKAILTSSCGSNNVTTVSKTHTVVVILLLTLQLWRRFYEAFFVCVFSKKASMSIFHLLFGFTFYLGAILIVLSEAPEFSSSGQQKHFPEFAVIDLVAVAVFLWAWYHQHVSLVILSRLRRNDKGHVLTEKYKLPQGDYFNYLSSPHYNFEIIMYTCLWVILGFWHSWWCVCILVLVNQVDSIMSSHNWYQNKFDAFPKQRKAFIPFLI